MKYWNLSTEARNERRRDAITICIQYYTGSPSQSKKVRKIWCDIDTILVKQIKETEWKPSINLYIHCHFICDCLTWSMMDKEWSY